MWQYRYKVPWLCSRDLLVGLDLRRAARGLRQPADDGAARQIDLEGVVPEALGFAHDDSGGLRERRFVSRLAAQRGLGLRVAPRLVGDAAERETRFFDGAAVELDAGG